jgi:hypothetical protein
MRGRTLSSAHRGLAKGHRGIQADEPKQTKSTVAVKRQTNAGAGKVQDPEDAAGELDWGCPRLPSMQNAGLVRKFADARVVSVSGARSRSLGRASCAPRRAHDSPPDSFEGPLGNSAIAIQRRCRAGFRLIACGSIASSVWSRRQKWW